MIWDPQFVCSSGPHALLTSFGSCLQTAADQLIWAPIMTAVFFAFLKLAEGQPEAVVPCIQASPPLFTLAALEKTGAHCIELPFAGGNTYCAVLSLELVLALPVIVELNLRLVFNLAGNADQDSCGKLCCLASCTLCKLQICANPAQDSLQQRGCGEASLSRDTPFVK